VLILALLGMRALSFFSCQPVGQILDLPLDSSPSVSIHACLSLLAPARVSLEASAQPQAPGLLLQVKFLPPTALVSLALFHEQFFIRKTQFLRYYSVRAQLGWIPNV